MDMRNIFVKNGISAGEVTATTKMSLQNDFRENLPGTQVNIFNNNSISQFTK